MIYDVLSCIALYIYWCPFVFLLFSMPRKYAPHILILSIIVVGTFMNTLIITREGGPKKLDISAAC